MPNLRCVPPKSVLQRAAWIAVGGTLLLACAKPSPNISELRSVPGIATVYPGSVVLSRTDLESTRNLIAANSASIRIEACTSASRSEVVRYFRSTLHAAGWTQDNSSVVTAPRQFDSGVAWRRSGQKRSHSVWLRFYDPAGGSKTYNMKLANYHGECVTGYEVLSY